MGLTVAARVRNRTRACVVVEHVDAGATIETWSAGARVNLLIAERSSPSRLTDTAEASGRRLNALCSVTARRGRAGVYLNIAICSRESWQAGAVETILDVDAERVVEARLERGAEINLAFAKRSREPVRAVAFEIGRQKFNTLGAILARL